MRSSLIDLLIELIDDGDGLTKMSGLWWRDSCSSASLVDGTVELIPSCNVLLPCLSDTVRQVQLF